MIGSSLSRPLRHFPLPKRGLDQDGKRENGTDQPVQRASVTFDSPCGLVGVEALARASAAAKSWPGTHREERRQERQLRLRHRQRGSPRPRSRRRRLRWRRRRAEARARAATPRAPRAASRRATRSSTPGRAGRAQRRGRARDRSPSAAHAAILARLEQLERDLARRRELGAAADHEHAADERERERERLRLRARAPAAPPRAARPRLADAVGELASAARRVSRRAAPARRAG